jgi:pyridinium-3,5-bisthiocarboxylic acid mononucleotide nickel chelatase
MAKRGVKKIAPLPQSAVDVVELSVNLDDQTGEVIGDAMEVLLAEGALDVWTQAIGMKKNRPGVMLSLLAAPGDAERLGARVLALTGSFGVRMRPAARLVLERRHVTAQCRLGEFRVKIGVLAGRVLVAQPEMADVKKMAVEAGVTLREAMGAAQAAAQELVK